MFPQVFDEFFNSLQKLFQQNFRNNFNLENYLGITYF